MHRTDEDDIYATFFPPLDSQPNSPLSIDCEEICERLNVDFYDYVTREQHAAIEGYRLAGISREETIKRLKIPEELFDIIYSEIWDNLLTVVQSEIIKSTIHGAMCGDNNARRDYFNFIEPKLMNGTKEDQPDTETTEMSLEEIIKTAKKLKIPLPKFKEHV